MNKTRLALVIAAALSPMMMVQAQEKATMLDTMTVVVKPRYVTIQPLCR